MIDYDTMMINAASDNYDYAPESHALSEEVVNILSSPQAWHKVFTEGLKAVLKDELATLDKHGKSGDDTASALADCAMATLEHEVDKLLGETVADWLLHTFFNKGDWPDEQY